MLCVRLDLSRKRLDWQALHLDGARAALRAVPADADGLAGLARRLGDEKVIAVIESMNGARFVHDRLELAGWDVRVADPVKCKGLAPLACKTDRIDAWVLAELARRDFVPEVWLPGPAVRAERERIRFRLHLVKHRTQLKNRVHSILIGQGLPCPVTDLFGVRGRELLDRLSLPDPWASTLATSLALIDTLDEQISECERELRRLGADHPYVPLLLTLPGVGWIHAFTLSSEIGDIGRFATPSRLIGYSGLNPYVKQSGASDWRGPLAKHGPRYLRWALVEAAHTAARQPLYQPIVQRQRARHGRRHGSKIAALVIGRKLAEASWHMLTRNQPFAPAGATQCLTA